MPKMPVERTITSREVVEVQMWQLAITRADVTQPAEFVGLFRPLTEAGAWDESAAVLRFQAVDDPTREDARAQTIVTDIRAAMLAATVPECEAVIRLEGLTGLSLAGLSFQTFGERLLGRLAQLNLLTQE